MVPLLTSPFPLPALKVSLYIYARYDHIDSPDLLLELLPSTRKLLQKPFSMYLRPSSNLKIQSMDEWSTSFLAEKGRKCTMLFFRSIYLM
jgi:hypothetical protein